MGAEYTLGKHEALLSSSEQWVASRVCVGRNYGRPRDRLDLHCATLATPELSLELA